MIRHTLAVYLDEVGEDPSSSCLNISESGVSNVILRYIWTNPIDQLVDSSCQILSSLLKSNNLSTIMIASELGKCEANKLINISSKQFDRVFNLTSYFKANFLRVYIGTKFGANCTSIIDDWMARVTEQSIKSNIIPVLEITNDIYFSKLDDIIVLLNKHRRWKVLYDPVQFILKQNVDVFVRYWTLLKKFVIAIDVRDLKIGSGFKPAGFGDAKIKLTIDDAVASNYNGWYFLEPSLGRRSGTSVGKFETFKMALDAFDNLF